MKNRKGNRGSAGYMDTPSAGIYYEEYGQGTPLVLLHGNAGTHRELHAYAKSLWDTYHVILMDSRGHGRSRLKKSTSGQEFTARDMAEDVKRLMDRLCLKQAILLGFSDGANTALEFSVCYPKRTLAVISVSGNALPSGLRFPVYVLMWLKYYGAGFFMHVCPSELLKEKLGQSRIFAALILRSPALTGERLKKIKAPVLLIAGGLDLVKGSHTRWMASRIPDSRLILIKGAAHNAFFWKRRLYLKYIKDFLKSRGLYRKECREEILT